MRQLAQINPDACFRLEEYTDNRVGSLIRMVPVMSDGVQDPMRLEQFIGKTNLQTNRGPIEVRFQIAGARTITEAFDLWLGALEDQMDQMESASRKNQIVNGAVLSPSEARALAAGSKKQ